MSKKRVHRVSVYVVCPEKRHVLLEHQPAGPFAGKLLPLSAPLNDQATPVELVEGLVCDLLPGRFEFFGHHVSMPLLLDERSLRIQPPLQIQVTSIDESTDFVDFVYVVQSTRFLNFDDQPLYEWVRSQGLKNAPGFVRHMVHHILHLLNH